VAYEQSLSASRPPPDEDWFTVAELIRAAGCSRTHAYGLLARGIVPFRVFSGIRYVHSKDLATLRSRRATPSHRSTVRGA